MYNTHWSRGPFEMILNLSPLQVQNFLKADMLYRSLLNLTSFLLQAQKRKHRSQIHTRFHKDASNLRREALLRQTQKRAPLFKPRLVDYMYVRPTPIPFLIASPRIPVVGQSFTDVNINFATPCVRSRRHSPHSDVGSNWKIKTFRHRKLCRQNAINVNYYY